MEEIKLRCTEHLFRRSSQNREEILKMCIGNILELDAKVRMSYGEEIKMNRCDLATTILYDTCFLLELSISQSPPQLARLLVSPISNESNPSPAAQLKNMELILSDLILLENQIPFLILDLTFDLIFPVNNYGGHSHDIVSHLVICLFGHYRDGIMSYPFDPCHILHLVHIMDHQNHHNWDVNDIHDNNIDKQIKSKYCVTKLLAVGVTIVKTNVNFVTFNDGILQIPPLYITQTMEVERRNLIAWELHKKRWKKDTRYGLGTEEVTFQMLLLNDLICCPSDIQVLKNKGIIVDEINMSNYDLLNLLDSITSGVDRGLIDSRYCQIIQTLNAISWVRCATNCVTAFPIILWHYLSRFSYWLYSLKKFLRRGYNFAAAMITLLTVIQTFYTVLSYHYPNK